MSASSSLLQDTLSFLAFLHTRDVRPMGGRWLTPSALRDLNAGLIVHDSLQPPARGRGGKRGTVERDTDRLRFIHFLCEAAHLVTKTGLYLKPTLRVPRWLAASPRDQLRTLFDAAYPAQPHRPHDELWRTYRLPGCTLSSPTLSLAPLFDILRRMAFTERLRLTTLLRLVPLPDDPARSETPDAILRGVLDQLAAFEVLIWRGQSIVQLTDLGAHLLNRPDALPSPREAHRMLVPVLGEGLGVRVEPLDHVAHMRPLWQARDLSLPQLGVIPIDELEAGLDALQVDGETVRGHAARAGRLAAVGGDVGRDALDQHVAAHGDGQRDRLLGLGVQRVDGVVMADA